MKLETNIDYGNLRIPRKAKAPPQNFADRWRAKFRGRARRHDPMLVLNMSVFNSEDGWNRVFNEAKIHENDSR
jgi:hypothetical protein